MEQEEKLCDEVVTVRVFTYLCDKVSTGGGYEATLTASTRCGWVKCMKCSEMVCGRKFPLMLKGAVYQNYVRPALLYGSEA